MKYYIGIDLGGTNVRTLLVDENGESYSEVKGPTECQNGPDYVCVKIIKQIESLDTSVCVECLISRASHSSVMSQEMIRKNSDRPINPVSE